MLVVIGITLFQIALNPARKIENKYETLAQKQGLIEPSNFFSSKRKNVYYSVIGKNKKNQQIAVLMKANDKKAKPIVLKMSAGLAYKDVIKLVKQRYQTQKIYSAGLAMYDGVPVWDISFLDNRHNLSFVTIQFSNGKQLKLIQNL